MPSRPPPPSLVARHLPLVGVLVAGALARLAFAVAFHPALSFNDSWNYLHLAYEQFPVGGSTDRPSGYPLLIRLLLLPHRSLAMVSTAQHVAGLLVGVASYALVWRLTGRRWLATLAAGWIVLDAGPIVHEQYLMSEAFFGLALAGAAYLAVVHRTEAWGVAGSGLLLAAAGFIRTAGLFAIPVWALYLLMARDVPWRRVALGLSPLVVPVLAYAAVAAALGKGFTVNSAGGAFLYGRVASLVDCRPEAVPPETRALCDHRRQPGETPSFFVWNERSPARRLFGDRVFAPPAGRLLRQHALAVIADSPAPFGRALVADAGRLWLPLSEDLPDVANPKPSEDDDFARAARERYAPEYRPPRPADGNPAERYLALWPSPLPGLTAAALAIAVAAAARRRRGGTRLHHRREAALLGGAGLAMLVLPVVTVEVAYRFLVPVQPLLICAAAVLAADLLPARRGAEGAREVPAPSRVLEPATT